ncbi:hypothetical protein [Streptomyces canus]|uniref:hypothetical protein n=1 Tax=Streptomyces canus TaxID=58343 RepID=UPI002E2A944E|nr:hypothetical protein [Streptomyces canus]
MRTAQETPASITAEIIAHSCHGAGLHLYGRTRPIHRTWVGAAFADSGDRPGTAAMACATAAHRGLGEIWLRLSQNSA